MEIQHELLTPSPNDNLDNPVARRSSNIKNNFHARHLQELAGPGVALKTKIRWYLDMMISLSRSFEQLEDHLGVHGEDTVLKGKPEVAAK